MLDFGREHLHQTAEPEWLVTNGIGGYASGSLSGQVRSRYHGLLIAALTPPLGRTLLLSQFAESVTYNERVYPLTSDSTSSPHLIRFTLHGTLPVWTYTFADALLEKCVWMDHGANTTHIRYELTRGLEPCLLTVRPVVNCRDSHFNTHRPPWSPRVTITPHGVVVHMANGLPPLHLATADVHFEPQVDYLPDRPLSFETARGLDDRDDSYAIGAFTVTLRRGETVAFAASTHPIPDMNTAASLQAYRQREQSLLAQSDFQTEPSWIQQLVLAADQFIVARPLPGHLDGLTVLAGYPWFSDWGRDTMIALPGLALATGRFSVAANILRTFARFVDQGMLPNRFPDVGEQPEYNTVDATLWYFQAIRHYVSVTQDLDLLRDLYPVLVDIIAWHDRGTRFGIHVDPLDGLLAAGTDDVQLTWMDVKLHTRYLPYDRLLQAPETLWLPAFLAILQMFGVETPNWVVTPRSGKQVEINALWFNALLTMAEFSTYLGLVPNDYAQLAARVQASFARFWNPNAGYCFDGIDTPEGLPDPTLRPNQLFAVALPHSPLTPDQQRQVVDVCARQLVTPFGLRSLAPNHPDYQGAFRGNLFLRDAAYHQGTVWSWLIGAFVEAHLRVYGDKAAARAYLFAYANHLNEHGLGTISEVFSGNPPHDPGGCLAQAWGVAEVLRAWQLCR
ncbi:MAG: glycogen debranching enzyme family protein [Chloroflexi bacterium]|uniref:amylo-alpha-1,6-glucosidase n=1 Tax=Candidatus Flexifilum breve TaxID=3140694 RepID=UPI003135F8EE|nr:glycogen debranching enzyme family protein [Chloroflexota bacterium]